MKCRLEGSFSPFRRHRLQTPPVPRRRGPLRKPWKWQSREAPILTANRFPGISALFPLPPMGTAWSTKGPSAMSGINVVFDICAIIRLLERRDDLAALGLDMGIGGVRFLTSVIVRMELLAKRGLSADDERYIRKFLADLVVAPLDEAVEQKAVEIRRATSLKLPDSIVAATAIVLDAILLTSDERLLNLSWKGLQTRSIF